MPSLSARISFGRNIVYAETTYSRRTKATARMEYRRYIVGGGMGSWRCESVEC